MLFKKMHPSPLFTKFWLSILALPLFTAPAFAEISTVPLSPSQGSQESAAKGPVESTLPIVAMGNPEAPLKIVMFHSLNCSHCKDFKDHVFPEIQKEFIDKGLVYFQFIDFPTDRSALDAAKIAWEARDVQTYETVSGILTTNYNTWAGQPDWQNELCKIVTQNQLMTEADCTKSLADEDLGEEILRISFDAQQKYKIDYAPAFLFNGKLKQTTGLLSLEDIKAELKATAGDKTQAK